MAASRPPDDGPAARGGLSVAEYEWRVWDMAKSLIHPAAIYVLIQVAAGMRLLGHPLFREPGAGALRELAFFGAGFLGAWAVFYSTLLRDSGLRSLTVTIVVPLAAVTALAVFLFLPTGTSMTSGELLLAAVALAGPGPVAWVVTMTRWRAERRKAAALLEEGGA